jgi:hypothetical protein
MGATTVVTTLRAKCYRAKRKLLSGQTESLPIDLLSYNHITFKLIYVSNNYRDILRGDNCIYEPLMTAKCSAVGM